MSTGIQQQCIMHPTIFQNLYGMKWYETHHQNPSPASSRFWTKNWHKSCMLVEKRSTGSPHFMQFHLECFTLYAMFAFSQKNALCESLTLCYFISVFFFSCTLVVQKETTYTVLLISSKASPLTSKNCIYLVTKVSFGDSSYEVSNFLYYTIQIQAC